MNCIIDFEDPNTYPKWIWTLFSKYPALQKAYVYAQGNGGDFPHGLELNIEDANHLIDAIKKNLQDWEFVAFHITRVVNVESIKQNGLKIMAYCDYIDRMCYIFRDVLNYTSDEVNRCKKVLREKLISEQACRIGQLSFFAPPSKYNLIERNDDYLSLYGFTVGGEVAKQAFQSNKKILLDLHESGETFLIKAKFYIATLLENCENDAYGFVCSLLYFAAQYLYSERLDCDAIILGQVGQSVPAENICEVIPIDDIKKNQFCVRKNQ